MTFAIFLAGAFVAACITGFAGFAFGRVGAAIWHALTPIKAMWLVATGELSSEIAGLFALALPRRSQIRPSRCFDVTNG